MRGGGKGGTRSLSHPMRTFSLSLGSHGTLVAVSAPLLMPLRDSGHSNEVCLVLSAALFHGNGITLRTTRVIQGGDNDEMK